MSDESQVFGAIPMVLGNPDVGDGAELKVR